MRRETQPEREPVAAAAIAIAALAVGTAAFAIPAMTEGPRFDGWVWIPPEQQILLKPKNTNPYWIPLADLTPQDAAAADGAVLRAKTGWALRGNWNVGWFVGWIERGDDAEGEAPLHR